MDAWQRGTLVIAGSIELPLLPSRYGCCLRCSCRRAVWPSAKSVLPLEIAKVFPWTWLNEGAVHSSPSTHLLASTVDLDLRTVPEGHTLAIAVWVGNLSIVGMLEAGLELGVLLATARVDGTNQLHSCRGALLELVLLG